MSGRDEEIRALAEYLTLAWHLDALIREAGPVADRLASILRDQASLAGTAPAEPRGEPH